MYNEKIKQEFINWYKGTTPPMYCEKLFGRIEVYEESYKKDVSTFIVAEISELLKMFGSSSIEYLRIIVSILRTYTDFCLRKNITIDGQNHYNDLDTQILYNCVDVKALSQKFVSEDEFNSIVSNIVNDCDKFLLQSIYEGLMGEEYCEVSELSTNDIDVENNVFHLCTGRSIHVSKKLVDIAVSAANTFEYYPVIREKLILDTDSDLAFKPRRGFGYDDSIHKYKRILKRMNKIKNDMSLPFLTIPRIRNSGIMTMTEKYAKMAGYANVEEFISSDGFEPVRSQYNVTQPSAQLRQMYREYMTILQ